MAAVRRGRAPLCTTDQGVPEFAGLLNSACCRQAANRRAAKRSCNSPIDVRDETEPTLGVRLGRGGHIVAALDAPSDK